MNERLKELYRQAHGTRHYDGDPALDGNPPTVYWQGEASAQRFANLIIRECMRMCDVAEVGYMTHGLDIQSQGCQSAKQYIADWFEVEE